MVVQDEAPGATERDRLLAAAIGHVTDHGVSDLSLRELAGAIGTSHRMLIYHFGSKDGLKRAIVGRVEQIQREYLAELVLHPSVDTAEAIRRLWRHLSDPSLWPHERLFYEIYGQALQGRPGTAGFLDGIVDAWVTPAAEFAVQQGAPPAIARADARLGVAVVRGLILDLLATRDPVGVGEALERYASFYDAPPG